jgi:hypothetical protein
VAAKILRGMAARAAEHGGGSGGDPNGAPEASDPSACTVWLGGVEEGTTEEHVR